MSDEGDWVDAGMADDVPDGGVVASLAGDEPIALYRVDGRIYATHNLCTHAEAYLSDGYLDGSEIECPLHAARFDIRSGKALCPPADCDVRVYPVRVLDGIVQVRLG